MKSKLVVVFGTFDLLHPGHLAFLSAARRRGDSLTVVLTRDSRVHKEKGARPFFSESERSRILSGLKAVDRVVLGDRGKRRTAVKKLSPDVICVGYDQNASHPAFLAQLAGLKKKPRVVRIKPLRAGRYSSSKIKIEIHKRGELKKRRLGH